MLHLWTITFVNLHFILIFQVSSGHLSFGRPGILPQRSHFKKGYSTRNTLANVLQLAFSEQQQSPKANENFSSYNASPQQNYNSPQFSGNAYGVPEYPTGYNKPGGVKIKLSSFKLTNAASGTLGMINLPFGERSTFALTFPPGDENLFRKPTFNSYNREKSFGSFYDQQSANEVEINKEATINVGSIVSDAFVLKERMDIQPGSPTGSNPSDPSEINRIINNAFAQNTAKIMNARNQPNIHSPGDLIAREIPLDGIIDYTGLNNLTEFLIRETSKPRSMKKLIAKQTAQTPMFVSLQFNTLGRQKIKSYNEGVEKKGRIHVVLGDKHFEIENISDLSRLYGQSQTTVELIKQFVHFSWKTHQGVFKNAERRSKDISDRLAALIQKNPSRMRFQPYRPLKQEQFLDFVTWPYVVTLAFRTLLV